MLVERVLPEWDGDLNDYEYQQASYEFAGQDTHVENEGVVRSILVPLCSLCSQDVFAHQKHYQWPNRAVAHIPCIRAAFR